MYKCPSCNQKVVPFLKKFLTGPMLHYHCPNCNASLSTSCMVVFFMAVFFALHLFVTGLYPGNKTFFWISGILWVLVPMYYWLFHAPIIIVAHSEKISK
jgi:hypothetical protein